ncbi:uncharacterized protein AB675_9603 [Cyphellophora attinorum]|uniref:Uncharacterized protein n=1 Tax=Cyphellophora attinorum TaxID=1664694 RepID=A0A0N1P0M9_9EURO|nr:uncharacterized protein AB675_9603 [Phialophora attinorum]KPI42296.1 hypothetical protein AB675_9603 [Phialophora attinorum]
MLETLPKTTDEAPKRAIDVATTLTHAAEQVRIVLLATNMSTIVTWRVMLLVLKAEPGNIATKDSRPAVGDNREARLQGTSSEPQEGPSADKYGPFADGDQPKEVEIFWCMDSSWVSERKPRKPVNDLVLKVARERNIDHLVVREGPHELEVPHVTVCFRSRKYDSLRELKQDWWTAHLYIDALPQGREKLVLTGEDWWNDKQPSYKGPLGHYQKIPWDVESEQVPKVGRRLISYGDHGDAGS